MHRQTSKSAFALLWVVVLLATSCVGTPTPEVRTVEQTVVVEQRETVIVPETVVVPEEVRVVVTATPEPAASVAQELKVAFNFDTGPLDPHSYGFQAFVGLGMVYEPLVVYMADGTIAPGLAESWETSDDGLTWTFHLRSDVQFSDGTPFNAEAAKWSLERWVGTSQHSWLPTTNIVGSIETPNDDTLVLRLTQFNYSILFDLALTRPARFLSPSAVDADGNFERPIGTGPWIVQEYIPDQRTVFVPNENYWGEVPSLSQVVFEVIPDPQTRVAALLSDEIDLIGGEYVGAISLESLPVLQRNEDISVITGPGTTTFMLMTNFRRPPFDDVRVRKAVNHAIDREAISNRIFGGLAVPAQGVFPPNVPYASPLHPEAYTYDVDQAKALLADAGWTPGADGILEKDGQPFNITLVVNATQWPQAKSMAEVVQAQLKEIGINLELRLTDFSGWLDARYDRDYDLASHLTYGAPYDPHSTLGALFKTGLVQTRGILEGVFTDAALDAMIAEVLTIKDENDRQAAYDELFSFLDDNAAAIPLVHSVRVYALDSKVEGFELAGTEYELNLNGVRISAP